MRGPVALDHAVINTRFDMDRAEARFARLGFRLTPRGFHSLGSINHLMMFATDYLELIGLPGGDGDAPPGRPEVAEAPVGLNGLVFKTDDVDETHAHLQAIGLAGDPPKSFSRPVDLPDGARDARFRTVHVRPGAFPGGRVYFCEHGTPDLVWRPEWQRHDNGARAILEFVIASEDRDGEAEAFSALLNTDILREGDALMVPLDGARLSLLSPQDYRVRYGPLACEMNARRSIFGALVLASPDFDALSASLGEVAADPALARVEPGRILVREPAFDTLIEFRN